MTLLLFYASYRRSECTYHEFDPGVYLILLDLTLPIYETFERPVEREVHWRDVPIVPEEVSYYKNPISVNNVSPTERSPVRKVLWLLLWVIRLSFTSGWDTVRDKGPRTMFTRRLNRRLRNVVMKTVKDDQFSLNLLVESKFLYLMYSYTYYHHTKEPLRVETSDRWSPSL